MKCQTCGKGIRASAKFCPYCGSAVQGLANVVAAGAASLPCTGCGASNMANARFCSNCGRQLPHSFGAGAQAAGAAQKTMPTSSSGRDPAGEAAYAERTRYLHKIDAERAERDALPPPPSGEGELVDLARAEEHFTRVDAAWEELDTALKRARSEAGMFPAAGDLAELADLERRTDLAWASRERARLHRQDLWDREYHAPGLPPGDPPW